MVDGELVEGLHPALVGMQTWQACQDVKKRNVRRTSKAWTKHTYPLTPILLCARCGGPMHGEADSRNGRIQRYYGCHVARRNRSAVHTSGPRCDARMFKSELLEDAIHHELSQLVSSGEMHVALRNRLRAAGTVGILEMLEGEAFQLWPSQDRVQLLAQRETARASIGIEVADRFAGVYEH